MRWMLRKQGISTFLEVDEHKFKAASLRTLVALPAKMRQEIHSLVVRDFDYRLFIKARLYMKAISRYRHLRELTLECGKNAILLVH